jgi:type I restriction enzyme M protein
VAIKKSELYSSLWASCDELRGGMDASQYKDYVLVLLFVKYVSDKYDGKKYAEINVPPGTSFNDIVALKGKDDIGDQINKKIRKLADANGLADMPDFNDDLKLGSGKEKIDRLTNLIAIFQNPPSISRAIGPRATTCSAMRMSISCAISLPRAAKAKVSSILRQR